MSQNIFKIYDGRTSFWQWDTGQKLIVLNKDIIKVYFSNKNMKHSIGRDVYEHNGQRVCDIPDAILQLPYNLIAYACTADETGCECAKKSVKFAVLQRPIPDSYIITQNEQIQDIDRRLKALEEMLADVEIGKQTFKKFDTVQEAHEWAKKEKQSGIIVVVRINSKWIAHMVEDDYSVTPICNCEGEMVEVNVFDGGDGDGYNEVEQAEIVVWDGGGAAGI